MILKKSGEYDVDVICCTKKTSRYIQMIIILWTLARGPTVHTCSISSSRYPRILQPGFLHRRQIAMLVGYPHLCLGVHQKLNVEAKKKCWLVHLGSMFVFNQNKKEKTTKRAWRIETFVRLE